MGKNKSRQSIKNLKASLQVLMVLGLSLLLSLPLGHAEFFSDNYGIPKQLDIVVGETKVIPVSAPRRLAIGNPEIADVANVTGQEVLISAKAAGETNLQIWDEFGQREIVVRVFEEDLGKLKRRLEDLFETASIRGITFQIGTQERKVFVLGRVPLRKKRSSSNCLRISKKRLLTW